MGGRIKASKVTTKDLIVETSMTIGGATVSADGAELNTLNIAAAGTIEASKAVVVSADKDAGDFRNLDCVNLDAGASGTAGTVDIFPATAANGKLIISVTDQGGAHNATLNMDAQTQATTVHISDPGAVANSYVMQSTAAVVGVTTSAAEINVLDGAPTGAPTYTIGAEGGNVINVGIQLKDANAADCGMRTSVIGYLSGDANGDTILSTAPNGGVAIGTDGLLIPLEVVQNAVFTHGNLAVTADATKFKTVATIFAQVNGVTVTKTAQDNLTFSAAHVITASKFGIVLIQMDIAGAFSTKVPGSPQAYDNAPAALAALPAADAGKVAVGYLAIENNAGDWTANTDDLTDASDVTSAAFTDATETTGAACPRVFRLVSEADGDIDINITETTARTMYLVLILPSGKIAASGAIAFT